MTTAAARATRARPVRRWWTALPVLALVVAASMAPAIAASAAVPISGAGSTWAQTAVDQWRRDVVNQGLQINYSGTGSSDGRRQFLNGTTDFAVSDIPFQFHPEDNSEPETPVAGTYAYMPVTAGGTVFMYNLTINGRRVTNLRLSGENVSKIFTGVITQWNDPLIAADNPGLTLPARRVVPVVRSDGSGSSAQFTLWMINRFPQLWTAYCAKVGRQNACGFTSFYPSITGMVAQSGDLGVSGYIAQSYGEGAIGYVNYSYALNTGFPVAKVLNAAGYYTEPTASNVAVSLSAAKINTNRADPSVYLTQDLTGVYANRDPRTYELSSYSYFILPTKVQGQFTTDKGQTLGEFSYYFMCQGQQKAEQMGYSPLPINLVTAGFDQIRQIPGVDAKAITAAQCNNPTFSADGHNKLIDTAPMPDPRDKQGYSGGQNTAGSGGDKAVTPVKPAAQQAQQPAAQQPAAQPTQQQQAQQPAPGPTQQQQGQRPAPTTAQPPAGAQPQGGQSTTARPATISPVPRIPGSRTTAAAPAAPGAGRPTSGSASRQPATGPRSSTASKAVSASSSAPVASGAAATPGQVCDPDTGSCAPTADAAPAGSGGQATDVGAVALAASSVPVTAPSGWGTSQTLMLVAIACAVLLFVVPPLVARRLDHVDSA